MVCLITDNKLVSPDKCMPKNNGIILVLNTMNGLISLIPVTNWRVCMAYRNLNSWTEKDHFPTSFINHMLDHLIGRVWYFFSIIALDIIRF